MRRYAPTAFAACCVLACLAGCGRKDAGEPSPSRPAVTAALDRTTLLSAVPEEAAERAPAAPPPLAGLHSEPAAGAPEFVFSARGGGVAFVVAQGDGFTVVHNGRAGERYAAVGTIALSPDGRRCAYGALAGGKWRMVVDGKEGSAFSTVKAPVFSPDGSHVAYQAMAGELWHLVVDATVNAGTRTRYATHAFDGTSSRIVFIDDVDDQRKGRLIVSDLGFQRPTVVDARVSSMTLNADGSRVAAVGAVGAQERVLAVSLDTPDRVDAGAPYDGVDALAFGPDGRSLAYLGTRAGESFVVMNGREEPLPAGSMLIGSPVIRPDGRGVGALVASGGGVALRHFFSHEGGPEAAYAAAEGLVFGGDGRTHAYAALRGRDWFVVVDGKEGPPFERVVTPVYSPDGKRLVYRARQDARRFVVVADLEGKTIWQGAGYEQVFPTLFTADGRSIAYGIKDGPRLIWKVEAP